MEERLSMGPALPADGLPSADPTDWRHDPRTLQVLTTEHWSLLASRSISWSESFNRAAIFLTALSGSVVALALVGQSTSYGSAFVGFALIILPVVLFIGLATLVRLGQVNSLDLLYIQAMNRIRHAYLELVPGVAPYLSTATHDDLTSLYSTFAIRLRPNPRLQLLTTAPAVVSVICSVVGGVIAGIVASQIWSGIARPIVAGAVGFLAMMVILQAYNQRALQGFARSLEVRFPQPSGGADRTTTPVP